MADNSTKDNLHLVQGGLLARNVVWSLLSSGAPLLVAIPVMPLLIRNLGTDRFGILTLAWALTGYAGLLDLGLGRALTQLVAKKLGAGEAHEVPELFWTSFLLMVMFGLLGAVILIGLSPWLSHHALKIPPALQDEAVRAFFLLGLSLPVVIASTGLRGLLEAHQRFDLVSTLRVGTGVFTFAGPLLVLPFTHRLEPVVGILIAGRIVGCLANFWLCLRVVPELRRGVAWNRPSVGPLLRFGGWMTVTNVVGPLMVTLDRFVIGALLSVAAVAYYATPYEVVTKLLLVPTAVVGVMFPAFSASYVHDKSRAAMLYTRSAKYVFLVLFPIVLLTVGLAANGLTIWLGSEFARHSTRVVQWLALGVLANSLGLVPFSLIQGVGRPDLTAKLHLIELPLYLIGLFWLIRTDGIEGAAIAWSVRTIVDAVVLFLTARYFLREPWHLAPRTKVLLCAALVTLILAIPPLDLVSRTVFLCVTIVGFLLVTWFVVLTPKERSLVGRLTVISR